MSFFQTDTKFRSHPVHPDCSIRTSPAVHQGAILQPQTQVTRSAASYSLLPLSDSIHNVPSSSLRVTISMPITFVTLHLMLIVEFHPPDVF